MTQGDTREAGLRARVAGDAEERSPVNEDLITGEVEAGALLALSDTHRFHEFIVSKKEPTLNP